MMSDELTKRDEAALSEMGVRLLPLLETMDHESLLKAGYREIPPAYLGELGMAFQHVPGMVTHFVDTAGTYRAIYDKSKGPLEQVKEGSKLFRPFVRGEKGRIKAQALLEEISDVGKSIHTIFSILAIVTGQYFLTQINSKLASMADSLDSIQQFMELDKRTEIVADLEKIQEIIRNYDVIAQDPDMKRASFQRLQTIRDRCLDHTRFYQSSCLLKKQAAEMAAVTRDMSKVEKAMETLMQHIVCYKDSLLSYALAYYLEVVLSEVKDSRYTLGAKETIAAKYEEYADLIEDVEASKQQIEGKLRLNSTFGKPKTRSYSLEDYQKRFMVDVGGERSVNIQKAISETAKQQPLAKADGLLLQLKDDSFLKTMTEGLETYHESVNARYLDVIRTEDKAYLKYLDVPPDEAAGREAAV